MNPPSSPNPPAAPCEIAPARPADFLAIAALDRQIWQGVPHCEFIPDGEHVWRIWCEHALVFIARGAGGDLAGAILAFPGVCGVYCIHKVMVSEAYRGKGIGSQLFTALLREIDQLKASSFLTVSPENPSAIALYRKWGFTQEEFVRGYYRESEHRLVLTRPPVTD